MSGMSETSSNPRRHHRILFWSGTFWPRIGGVEILAARLLPALQERGYRFTVITPQSSLDLPLEDQFNGIPVQRVPFGADHGNIERLLEMQTRMRRLRRDFAPDLVHANTVSAIDYFLLTSDSAHPAPLLVTLHGEWLDREESIVRQTLSGADWVVGCSAAILDRGRGLVPEIVSRSSVIHNGLDAPPMPASPLPTEPAQVLCVGRLVVEKGFDLAIAAFAAIADRFPRCRLVIAGDGPERERLERQVDELGVTDLVDLAGWFAPSDVFSLINGAAAVVVPSRHESFSLVALQAALMARPVVATRVGGLPEVVVDGQTGLLVEPGSSDALAEAIAWLLEHPQKAVQIGQAGRQRAEEVFAWDRYVDAYDALYQRLIGRSAHKGPG